MDETPIYDIKPYLAYADSHPDAVGGFTKSLTERKIEVVIETELFETLPEIERDEIVSVLSHNPTPSYKGDGAYAMNYSDYDVSFEIRDNILYVTDIRKTETD